MLKVGHYRYKLDRKKVVAIYVAIDLGGTHCRLFCFHTPEQGDAPFDQYEFLVSQYPKGDFKADFKKIEDTITKAAKTYGQDVDGISLAIAGKVDRRRERITGAGNLTHWVNEPITQRLIDTFQCPVILGNDSEAPALAEALYGAGDDDFWFLIWGTGIGGCHVRHHYDRVIATPGEVGHQMVYHPDLANQLCICGQWNCLEAHCGSRSLRRWFGKSPRALNPSEWYRAAEVMAIGIRNIVTIQPTDRIFFSGGIGANQLEVLRTIEEILKERLMIVDAPSLQVATHGNSNPLAPLALLNTLV